MREKICVVMTSPYIANIFLRRHLVALSDRYDITLAVNTRDRYPLTPELAGLLHVEHIPIERRTSPLRDALALSRIITLLRRLPFKAVHSVAPKAGLLGMLAGWIARTPIRIHTFQGEVWASRRSVSRAVLKTADRLVARLATHVLVVGQAEQRFLEREGVLRAGSSTVLANGSICGVDTARFHPNASARIEVRRELAIPEEASFVIMYLGRLTRDKGVLDLALAFRSLHAAIPQSSLVFVGADEDDIHGEIASASGEAAAAVRFVAYNDRPERYMAAADVVCLPSYREGFPITLLEAGACGVPVVASRIYGTRDAVVEGETGLLHEPGSASDLERCLALLAKDAALRKRLGLAGRARVAEHFRPEDLVDALVDFYVRALKIDSDASALHS